METRDSKDLLKIILEQLPFYNPECVEVKYAYNRTEGLTVDLLEAARQKEIEENLTPTNFWEMFTQLVAPRPWFLNLLAGAYFATGQADRMQDQKILAQIQEHLALYDMEPSGNRLLLIPHSQGNLFANEEWLAMTPTERDRVSIVAIATPAATVADGGPYTTIEEDTLITNNFVGELDPNVPAPNRDDGNLCPDDWICHGFGTSYLFPNTASRVRILADIEDALPSSSPVTITVDGDPSEWAEIPVLITDPVGDSFGNNPDILSIKVTNDYNFVYFLETLASPPASATFLSLDTDVNPATGCEFHGAEFGIAFGFVGQSFIGDTRGNAGDCGFGPSDFPGHLVAVISGNVIEASVPISTLEILMPGVAAFDMFAGNDHTEKVRYVLVR